MASAGRGESQPTSKFELRRSKFSFAGLGRGDNDRPSPGVFWPSAGARRADAPSTWLRPGLIASHWKRQAGERGGVLTGIHQRDAGPGAREQRRGRRRASQGDAHTRTPRPAARRATSPAMIAGEPSTRPSPLASNTTACSPCAAIRGEQARATASSAPATGTQSGSETRAHIKDTDPQLPHAETRRSRNGQLWRTRESSLKLSAFSATPREPDLLDPEPDTALLTPPRS